MCNAKYFSKLDASQAFWQIKLDEESCKLTTFNTPFGRYCFTRLPYGINSATEIFHKAMERLFEGLEGVRKYVDDVIVWGSDKFEHDARLAEVMKRVNSNGLQLNEKKCQFATSQIKFLGEILSAEGIQVDPERVVAINNLAIPRNKTELRRIFGMINHVGRFLPNLSAKTQSIRALLTNSSDWNWTYEHNMEWRNLKETLATKPILKYFDTQRNTNVSTDA